jgi:hypothetical protein
MVGDNKKQTKLGENRGILKPSWAFIKTKKIQKDLMTDKQLYGWTDRHSKKYSQKC